MGAAANDLKEGDAGTEAEGVVRKKRKAPAGGKKAPAGKKGSSSKVTNEEGDEWDEDEEFEAVILSRKISVGMKEDGFRKGTEIYHISWPGYSAAAASWERRSNVGLALIEEWE
eukprot:3324443-Prymnesium_polylepis.1